MLPGRLSRNASLSCYFALWRAGVDFQGMPLNLPSGLGLRRLAVAGLVVIGTAGLSACNSFGDLFDSGSNKVTGPPVTGKTEMPDIPTLSKRDSSIAVLVNEDPITNYDITQRQKLMALGGAKSSAKLATDELIDETLEVYEARKKGVRAPDAQVDDAYAGIAQQLKLSTKQLTQALTSRGIDEATLKKRLRAQLTWQYLVQRRTQSKATVKTEDVTNALLAKGDPNQMTLNEYILQQIVFIVPQGSSPSLYAQRRREAMQFRERFKGCDSSVDQAKQLRGVVVKNIGRRDDTQLQGKEGEDIKKTPLGKTAPPYQMDQGIELIAVCSVRQVQSQAAARAEVTNDLYGKQAQNLGKDYLEELRKAAIIEYR
jgi:peptidyl-prolyl cis-trans isomerase SurA